MGYLFKTLQCKKRWYGDVRGLGDKTCTEHSETTLFWLKFVILFLFSENYVYTRVGLRRRNILYGVSPFWRMRNWGRVLFGRCYNVAVGIFVKGKRSLNII